MLATIPATEPRRCPCGAELPATAGARQRFCSARCRWRIGDRERRGVNPAAVTADRERARDYREARSASTPSRSPRQVQATREIARRWAAEHRGCRRSQPMLLGPPPFAAHLPGGGCEITLRPYPAITLDLRTTRLLHAAVTGIVGEDHDTLDPTWALLPWPRGCGWAVYWWGDERAAALAGTEHQVRIGDQPVTLRFGPLGRIQTPRIERRGRRRLRIDTLTPVLFRCNDRTREVVTMYTAPTADTISSSLRQTLARRLGLVIPEEQVPMRLISRETEPQTLSLGSKFGTVRGWAGHAIVETNAIGHWLLEAAARGPGLGAKTAFGFGRVRISPV